VALHESRLLLVGEHEPRVLHTDGPRDLFPQKVRIGLLRRLRQGDGQQVEAEIGIEDGGAGREQQGLLLEPGGESVSGYGGEWVVVGTRLVRDLARQSAGMGGEVDEPDALRVAARAGGQVGRPFGERLRQLDRAVGGEMSQHLPREGLGDRA